ncbi:MAG TPA: hypothetical protein VF240_09060 [Pyrinomonadaceae bacterium]
MKNLTSPLVAALLALQPLVAPVALPHAASPATEIARETLSAQTSAPLLPTPTPAEAGDSDVVRITTNLVQIDAVVTDKQGRLVYDLGPEDFEILEDGEPREITNFSFVSAGAAAAGERTGSASQFVEVPNLGKERLALSGMVLMGVSSSSGSAANDAAPGAADASPQQQSPAAEFDPDAVPAVRRFRQGASIEYYLHVYNAKLDPATGKPVFQYHARLFRDAQQVFAGNPVNFNPGQQTDMKRLLVGGRLRLGAALPPGEYVLQVVVNDTLAKEKHRMATQWIDFEIVK